MVKSTSSKSTSSNFLVQYEQTLKTEILNDFMRSLIELQSDTDYQSLVIDEQNSRLRVLLEKQIMTTSSSSKGGDKPKRVGKVSAYNLFVRNSMQEVKKQYTKHYDVMIEISRQWKALSDDEKQVYTNNANEINESKKKCMIDDSSAEPEEVVSESESIVENASEPSLKPQQQNTEVKAKKIKETQEKKEELKKQKEEKKKQKEEEKKKQKEEKKKQKDDDDRKKGGKKPEEKGEPRLSDDEEVSSNEEEVIESDDLIDELDFN